MNNYLNSYKEIISIPNNNKIKMLNNKINNNHKK